MADKDTSDLISVLGPSEKHRTEVQQTWFGTLIGQATVAVTMVVAYLAAIGLLYRYVGDALDRLQSSNPILFYGGIGLPLAFVGIFSVLPTILRARREQKLRPLSRNDTPPEPGYFRLHPYELADAKRFNRPDGALADAMAWLEGTKAMILYLSGASGSGKSSLVDAGLTPALRAKGWEVLLVRGMGTPLAALTQTLQASEELFAKAPSTRFSLRKMLTLASEERGRVRGGPLLIVMDQFEEFLILNQDGEKDSYAAFLHDLAADKIPNIRLMHVFRSDYRELIFRERLPAYVDRDTAFSVPCFTRRDAESFLNDGPVRLDTKGYDALFAGLDRIEDAHGLYRPITLNMVGFVLERQGNTLAADPGQLIETYLRDCITVGESKDFAALVLEALITREGTKAPRGAGELAEATLLKTWQVQATLSELRRQGLVRSVSGIWEISHDFLARVIGQVTGRLRRPWFARVATPTLTLAGIGWLVAMGIGVPAWVQWHEARALRGLLDLGFAQERDVEGGLKFSVRDLDQIDDQSLLEFGRYAKSLRPIHALDLSYASRITSLAGIEGLSELTKLELSGLERITSLAGIAGLTSLKELSLSRATGITSLAGIEGLTALTFLDLSDATGITSLAGIEGLTALTELHLSGATGITSLAGIEGLTALTKLYMSDVTGITSLAGIEGLTALTELDLSFADRITSLAGIESLTALTELDLSYVNRTTSLAGIESLTALTKLNLSGATGITSLAGIEGLTALTELKLIGATGITSLAGIEGLTALKELDLSGATGITSLAGIEGLTALTKLYMSDVTGITSLAGIERLTALTELYMTGVTGITSLAGIEGLTSLTVLNLRGATGITSLAGIEGLTALKELDLSGATGITSLAGIEGLTALTMLDLTDATGITSLAGIEGLTALTVLDLSEATGITSLAGIEGLTALTELYMSGVTGITSLAGIEGLTSLTVLNLGGATGITSLAGIEGLTALTELNLGNATGITSLAGIEGLTALTVLNLSGATGITSLAGIEGLTALTELTLIGTAGITSLSGTQCDFLRQVLDLTIASGQWRTCDN